MSWKLLEHDMSGDVENILDMTRTMTELTTTYHANVFVAVSSTIQPTFTWVC